jgi:hypothetical protein
MVVKTAKLDRKPTKKNGQKSYGKYDGRRLVLRPLTGCKRKPLKIITESSCITKEKH